MHSLWQVLAILLSVTWAFLISPGTAEESAIIDGRIISILQREYPELFSPDFDMVKRYSKYAFGLGKRKPNFSFGLGKRQQLSQKDNTQTNSGYVEGGRVRKRRGVSDDSKFVRPYQMEQSEVRDKRSDSYGFGIGKRYSDDLPQDIYSLTRQNFMNYLANSILSKHPYYTYQTLPASDLENAGDKRGKTPYSFGLGKRAYSFGLGKREYSFGLGKRMSSDKLGYNEQDGKYDDSINKRQSGYHFGLGKRSYDFGLGKKSSAPF